jgi:hypothetical protein
MQRTQQYIVIEYIKRFYNKNDDDDDEDTDTVNVKVFVCKDYMNQSASLI